ncbi:MAG TPA: ImmA/IrrE family metallo-endopeptidase [Candidatus Saccharimonadales bacterium]|nr:ImmA/IrrE family metallo-endopeptidase [Candidatus Saccharimonadales bacterium]
MAVLTKARQKEIDAIISEVELRTGLSYPENNLLELAKAEDIAVYEADLSALGPNISGVIEYSNDTKKTDPKIFLNKNISAKRKVFTLAHELGHHFLHEGRKLRVDNLDYSKDDKDTQDETEANYFAASILVPQEIFLYKLRHGSSTAELAEYFGVSLPVIENRLKWVSTNGS